VLLGVLVASSPAEGDAPLIESAVHGALQSGDSIELFLMGDGVAYALTASVRDFLAAGVDVTLCAMDAEARALDLQQVAAAGVTLGSQRDHARLLLRCQRFLSFT
jgi:sulfur relay (sulfurtransferase) complex TusBCD TusD component (DsrE family)